MILDRASEDIVHFIGLFTIPTEQSWQRLSYDKGDAMALAAAAPAELPQVNTPFAAEFELKDYDPGFDYRSVGKNDYEFPVQLQQVSASCHVSLTVHFDDGFVQASSLSFVSGKVVLDGDVMLPDIPVPGSIANYVHQWTQLSDDDYFGVGAHGLKFTPAAVGDADVLAVLGSAEDLAFKTPDTVPGNVTELKSFVDQFVDEASAYAAEPTEGQSLFVARDSVIEGNYLDGEKVEELPLLDDHFSFDQITAAGPSAIGPPEPNVTLTEDGWQIDVRVDLDTGSNVLINNAVVKNVWTAADATIVVGNHVEVNAIAQVNAWSDTDSVSSELSGWNRGVTDTQAVNAASFERLDLMEETEVPDTGAGFPDQWVVKEISGNVMVVNWQQQLAFMSDNDIGILSSSGVTTSVQSGANVAYNDISIYELGFAYDLIVVGGDCYDVNIIRQMNILCDNDTIGTLPGFEAKGEASFATSGNLLWNEAQITTIGGANRLETLPDDYRDAADALAAGNLEPNGNLLSNPVFAGLGALSALYITGDLINVQYLSMTNILGDSDQIALAMDAIGPHPEADWTITTGNNTLINYAAILDLDSFGTTYVGGDQYSNEILIQADIISTTPDAFLQDPDALASEAVAFLTGEDEFGADDWGQGEPAGLDPDNAFGDVLQSLIG